MALVSAAVSPPISSMARAANRPPKPPPSQRCGQSDTIPSARRCRRARAGPAASSGLQAIRRKRQTPRQRSGWSSPRMTAVATTAATAALRGQGRGRRDTAKRGQEKQDETQQQRPRRCGRKDDGCNQPGRDGQKERVGRHTSCCPASERLERSRLRAIFAQRLEVLASGE